ncbi:hypothetical protein V6N13_085017 [Hibiscus sabdariffa]
MKPVRDAMTEALQLWKKIAGETVGMFNTLLDNFISIHAEDGDNPQSAESSQKNGLKNKKAGDNRTEPSAKESSDSLSPTSGSVSKDRGGSIPERAVVILKKKAPALTDKELNPEFFQKLESRGSGDLPVEVVIPRRYHISSNSKDMEESEPNDSDARRSKNHNMERGAANLLDKWPEEEINQKDPRTRAFDADGRIDVNKREPSGNHLCFSKVDGRSEGYLINSKGNWLAIQRQLLQLERQQANLMNMLQDFMGGSHHSMVMLQN